MMKRKILISILLSMILIFTTTSLDRNTSKENSTSEVISKIIPENITAEAAVTPYHEPTADPVILLFIWLTSGYDLQPENQYTYVNNPKTLYTDAGRSVLDVLLGLTDTPHYTWYQSTDGVTWTQMSSQTGKNLTVTPNKVGTVYYQQRTQWYTLFATALSPTVYSKVALVTTFDAPVKATSLKVTADSNYLYNNQENAATTFARATPTPINATGNVTWSIDDTSLATIDSKTGLVTANTNKKSGTVKVTGTMTNHDGTSVTDSVNIKIGGGLDDQTVTEGQKTTFSIQGKFDQKPTSVVWHRVSTSGQDTVVDNSGNNMTYTTPTTTASDNGSKYYAVITITSGSSTSTITTNQALLTVNKNVTPAVTVTNTIFNNSYNDHDSGNTTINNVAKGDKVSYHANLNDTNTNSSMTKATFSLTIPVNSTVESLKVNNQDYHDYTVTSDTENMYITINNLNFSSSKQLTIQLDTTIGDTLTSNFVSKSSLSGFDNSNNNVVTTKGQNTNLNFANNSIVLKANDWDYGNINAYTYQKLINRNKLASSPLEVTDNRREKKALKLYLAQSLPFKSGQNELPSELRYYQNDGTYSILNSEGTLVSEMVEGESLNSVNWEDSEGPQLYINNVITAPGNYSTSLEWSLVESI